MRGLVNFSGITSTTFTAVVVDRANAGPRRNREVLERAAAALGTMPDTLLMAPWFDAWLYSSSDTSKRPLEA